MSQALLPLKDPLVKMGLLSPQCFNELFLKFNFGAQECLKAFLSKGLGYGIVAGSAAVKLPQIFKIAGSGSAEGISLLGTLLELTAVTATLAYSVSQVFRFPLNNYSPCNNISIIHFLGLPDVGVRRVDLPLPADVVHRAAHPHLHGQELLRLPLRRLLLQRLLRLLAEG